MLFSSHLKKLFTEIEVLCYFLHLKYILLKLTVTSKIRIRQNAISGTVQQGFRGMPLQQTAHLELKLDNAIQFILDNFYQSQFLIREGFVFGGGEGLLDHLGCIYTSKQRGDIYENSLWKFRTEI